MKYYFTPLAFQHYATRFQAYRWQLLSSGCFAFILYIILNSMITVTTPNALVWVTLFIMFAGVQALVFSAFIFFFLKLPSTQAQGTFWYKLYRTIEWSEAILFTFLLPLPSLTFVFALIQPLLVS